jgi:hypothetical protein
MPFFLAVVASDIGVRGRTRVEVILPFPFKTPISFITTAIRILFMVPAPTSHPRGPWSRVRFRTGARIIGCNSRTKVGIIFALKPSRFIFCCSLPF